MAAVSAFLAGGVVGARHALESDHLAAIATLVDGEERSALLVGASWGVGHALPIVVLGLAFVALGVRVPSVVTTVVEGVVGLVLVALGVRMVLAGCGVLSVRRHSHGAGRHRHLRLGTLSLGRTHVHLNGDSALVGLLHGMAGSGAIVVTIVAASPTDVGAVSFLTAFSLASVVTMATVSLAWGRALSVGLTSYLRIGAGLVGIAVGLALAAGVALA